jgi:hypothetical protein
MFPYSNLKYLVGKKTRNILVFLSEVWEDGKVKIEDKHKIADVCNTHLQSYVCAGSSIENRSLRYGKLNGHTFPHTVCSKQLTTSRCA